MVFTCKRCGAPLPVDDARIPKTAFRLKCNQCQNLMKIDPPAVGAGIDQTSSARPVPAPPAKPAPPRENQSRAAGPQEQNGAAQNPPAADRKGQAGTTAATETGGSSPILAPPRQTRAEQSLPALQLKDDLKDNLKDNAREQTIGRGAAKEDSGGLPAGDAKEQTSGTPPSPRVTVKAPPSGANASALNAAASDNGGGAPPADPKEQASNATATSPTIATSDNGGSSPPADLNDQPRVMNPAVAATATNENRGNLSSSDLQERTSPTQTSAPAELKEQAGTTPAAAANIAIPTTGATPTTGAIPTVGAIPRTGAIPPAAASDNGGNVSSSDLNEETSVTEPSPPVILQEQTSAMPATGPTPPANDNGQTSPATASKDQTSPTPASSPATAAIAAPDQPHYLQKIKLFSQLSGAECLMVECRLRPREYAPRQVIVKEGGPGDSMYFISDGAVEIRKRDPNTGIDFLLTELKAGSCFGEMALLTGKARGATVIATEPTTCGILDTGAFDQLMLGHPKIGLALSRVLAERLEESNQQSGIEYIHLNKLQFDARVLSLLPLQVIQQHKVLPVGFSNNRLTLAMVNPNNLVALDDVRRLIKGVMIEPVVTAEDDFKRFMTTKFVELSKNEEEKKARDKAQTQARGKSQAGGQAQGAAAARAAGEGGKAAGASDGTDDVLESLQSEALKSLEVDESQQKVESVTDLSKSAEDAPIIRLANNVLALAIKKGASDIHIEPQEKEVLVRFRMDGALQEMQVLPKKIQMGLISRLKILSKLDIAEKRLPQDGRISVRMEDRPIDFRVSTIPSKWGEKICMRILDKSNTLLGLDKLILLPDALEQVRDMISQPYGIIYVTGPTGSGKTTSLYSALAELNDPDVNISTAEDPIEYDLSRVNQVQAHKDIGLDFARILRAFLRQDPDIILVGETRDKETAHIAVEAALTGHLVFTTLHTNDAAGAFVRLNEMGVEPFLMSSSTIGVMAQRLTRRLCQACKEPYTPDEISMKYMGLAYDPATIFYRNKGCDKCSFTGFKGRVGVYEVLRMNGELRKLVASGGKTEEITEVAVRNGMTTLKNYSVWLLKNGWTTMEEVLQVVAVQE